MVIVKATKSSEDGVLPSEQLLTAMSQYNEELIKAGIMKSGDGLKPSSEAKRVHFQGNQRTVTDGPFAETKELIAGFWIWEVASMQEAVEWVQRCPNPMPEESDIEIRPLYEMDDFVDNDTEGAIRAREQAFAQVQSLQNATVQPYLFFGGRCEEALSFYEQALGAVVVTKMRFDQSPDPLPEDILQAGFEHNIMHASFKVGQMTLMASDGCGAKTTMSGFRLTLAIATEKAADAAFDALAEGGSVDMPLAETFWSPRFGMVTDRFGVGWMVMVPEVTS
ncbi:YciI family protein [Rubripirellula amarantea]|nr:YciI family protein [Rubripirellula amarantea]MDA8743702.1 YciI family protein [Rubripirellula amarantea]